MLSTLSWVDDPILHRKTTTDLQLLLRWDFQLGFQQTSRCPLRPCRSSSTCWPCSDPSEELDRRMYWRVEGRLLPWRFLKFNLIISIIRVLPIWESNDIHMLCYVIIFMSFGAEIYFSLKYSVNLLKNIGLHANSECVPVGHIGMKSDVSSSHQVHGNQIETTGWLA